MAASPNKQVENNIELLQGKPIDMDHLDKEMNLLQ